MAGKGRKGEEKLDWESLGMDLDADFNPLGERLASEEAAMSEILDDILGVRAAKIRVSSRVNDAEGLFRGAAGVSMFPVGQFSPEKMEALFGDGGDDDFDECDECDDYEESGEVPGQSGNQDSGKGIVIYSEAEVYAENGNDVIAYDMGDGIETKIVISREGEKPIVSIVRSGSLRNSIVLEEGRRHISVYGLKVMPIEMAVYAKKVRVDFSRDEGGSLELEYLVELRGLGLQRSRVSIQVDLVKSMKEECQAD